jgi:2'-hydroxyisoflavone reductase
MNLLLLGGTGFVGRHVTEAALERGHAVTILHRGKRASPRAGIESIRGDRETEIDLVRGRTWDAVVDICAYHPRSVDAASRVLAGACGRYVFVSTISVYADFPAEGADEGAPLAVVDDATVAALDVREPERGTTSSALGAAYGPLKARCERRVLDTFADRALIVRPGVISGPFDRSGRLAYWVDRIARGGEVLAPGEPDQAVCVIDVRDLCAWMIAAIERGLTGVFNATGESNGTMSRVLHACAERAETRATLTWTDERFLIDQGVTPWRDLPLWLEASESPFFRVKNARAVAAGLRFRPLAETAFDTLAWQRSEGDPSAFADFLPSTRESELLAAWRAVRGARA